MKFLLLLLLLISAFTVFWQWSSLLFLFRERAGSAARGSGTPRC